MLQPHRKCCTREPLALARVRVYSGLMSTSFVGELRRAGIPASLKEQLGLLDAMKHGVIPARMEDFYYLSRTTFVKDESLLDRFDQVFAKVFKGLEGNPDGEAAALPEDWLKAIAEKYLSPEEMEKIKALGWDEVMETLKKRPEERKEKKQGD